MKKLSFSKKTFFSLLIAAVLSILLVTISWQSKSEYLIDFEKPQSSAFTKDKPEEMKYGGAVIALPGIGHAGKNEYELEFAVRGAVLDRSGIQPQLFFSVNGVQIDAFQLDVKKMIKVYQIHDAPATLELNYQILREQEVKLRYVKLYYFKIKQLNSNVFQIPHVGILLKLAASMLIIFLIPLLFNCRLKISWIMYILFSAVVFTSLLMDRVQTLVLTDLLFILSILIFLISIGVVLSIKYIFKTSFTEKEDSKYLKAFILAIVFFLGFKLLFVLHPSLISLDLNYHSKNLSKVLSGDLNLITVYPGDIYQIPYPPLFYILVAPFTLITAKYRILLKVIFALIEIASPVLIGLIARKLFGGMKYAFWTFISYSLIPFSYRCISAGFIAEQFAQLLFLSLVLLLLSIKEFKLKNDIAVFLLLFALLMSHFGIVIKFFISFLALLLLYKIVNKAGIPLKRIILLLALASAATYFIFYVNYNDMIFDGVKKVMANRSPIPDEMQKSATESFLAQINYFGKYFFLPVVAAILGILLYLHRAFRSRILKSVGKTEHIKNSKKETNRKLSSEYEKKGSAIGLWLLITYGLIFLVWWLTPLKVRHFNFSLIVVAIFSAYFICALPTNLKRYKFYLAFGLCVQTLYLFVILNRLVFYFYRAYIN